MELRQKFLNLRRRQENKEKKSAEICSLLENSEEFKKAKKVLFFAPKDEEVNLFPLIKSCNKRVFLPRVLGKNMEICEIENFEKDTEVGSFGILEPTSSCSLLKGDLDLILVPAVVVDKKGNRIGFGGGYYDRFLAIIQAEQVEQKSCSSNRETESRKFCDSASENEKAGSLIGDCASGVASFQAEQVEQKSCSICGKAGSMIRYSASGESYSSKQNNQTNSQQKSPPKTIAIVFSSQIIDKISQEPHDIPVDAVLSEDGFRGH